MGGEGPQGMADGTALRVATARVDMLPEASIDNAKTAKPKYSAGPNSNANFANSGAAKIKTIKLKIPPKTLDTAASPNALPGSPFLAIG